MLIAIALDTSVDGAEYLTEITQRPIMEITSHSATTSAASS
jgi:hypothetical protein